MQARAVQKVLEVVVQEVPDVVCTLSGRRQSPSIWLNKSPA